ncbi:MAG: NAD(P)/FAD-dependent oxidoreductase [Gammaproteobacteria bacterium]|uniref:NAD(P)/FAD-dependent oxidoreductase n=1 Tax=Pseudacidovorax sp. TaxID=1934311 RepID=UPI001B7CD0EA|nr:tryptophan 7-halogenase [Pseudacidovorax sp.]MBP6893093.1 tryptophan 7-halogenase [Pseudacidovorax sp.]
MTIDSSSAGLSNEDMDSCDVFVIGGGPAGATAAALLARQGRRVVMAEKAHHPRFHIGESLLPANVELFDRLGVREQVERVGMAKWGAEFVSQEHGRSVRLGFGEGWDKKLTHAWQVRRSDLDEILFRHAAKEGATALEGCRVREVAFDDQGATIHATLDDGSSRQWRARFVVDASGRDTFMANRLKSKLKNPRHNSSALFGHFRNAWRAEGMYEGYITIFWFKHGWFWYIPLADGTVSVGAVCWPYYLKSRDKPLKEFFADTIAMSPELAERLKGAELVDDAVYATGNYSYSGTHCTGQRYLMLGDAFAFIDPVFSSGVYLAMHSAFEGAELVATTLDQPSRAPAARRAFERYMRKGPKEFSWFIFRVTNPTMREFFMYPQNPFRVKEALMSLLAGDIHNGTPIWRSLRILKTIYYAVSAANPRRTWHAWQRRRRNIRDLGPLAGENVLERQ